LKGQGTLTSPWMTGAAKKDGSGNDYHQFLYLGGMKGSEVCSDCTVLFDELRISSGVLSRQEMLHQDVPLTGEALVHMRFEGDFDSRSYAKYKTVNVNKGTVAYASDVAAPYLTTAATSSEKMECLANAQCLTKDSGALYLHPTYWGLGYEYLTEATIEFFFNAGTTPYTNWSAPFQICTVTDKEIPFLMQKRATDQDWSIRLDSVEPVTANAVAGGVESVSMVVTTASVPMFDGKWHHVAVTIRQLPSGLSEFAFYVDRKYIGTSTTVNYAWRGFKDATTLRIDASKVSGGCLKLDEFRITKGVLDQKDFLRARNHEPGGLMLFVR